MYCQRFLMSISVGLAFLLFDCECLAVSPPVHRLRNLPSPVTRFPIVGSSEAQKVLTEEELVLGVEIDGQSRAYPINLITRPEREVINDTLGGRPIVATWCKNCFNGIIYSRLVGRRTLTFQTYGLWNNTLAMRDVETKSIWSHLLGKAIKGPSQGTSLEIVPSVITDWRTWSQKFPNTTVAVFSRLTDRFSRESYSDPTQFVLGIGIADERLHFPFPELNRSPVNNVRLGSTSFVVVFIADSSTALCYDANVEGVELSFEYRDGKLIDTGSRGEWDPMTGRALGGPHAGKRLRKLPAVVSYGKDWERFYPESQAWRAAGDGVSREKDAVAN
jgi:hypothetical protein